MIMILKKGSGVFLVAAQLWIHGFTAASMAQERSTRPLAVTPAQTLAALFTPARPVLGRYEVFVTAEPIGNLAKGPIEALEAVDAFGLAGPYDRAALVRLYRGVRAQIARSWTVQGGDFESLTFISPYPDPSFRQLLSGTLTIRWICDARCRMSAL